MEPLEFKIKWKVLDEVGNNISYYNRFVQDSDLLKGFIRYRYEPNLIETFTILSKPENEAKLFDLYGMNYTSFDKANQARCAKFATLSNDKKQQMNFGNIVILMSKFGSKSGDFAQRG